MSKAEKDRWYEQACKILYVTNLRGELLLINPDTLADRIAQVLRAELKAEAERAETYKRIADRNHQANLMPCPQCGYVQSIIRVAQVKERE